MFHIRPCRPRFGFSDENLYHSYQTWHIFDGVETDWRDAQLAEQAAEIAELNAKLAERDRIIGEQQKQIERLVRRIAELEERLGKTSRNSSKPPSSDPPWIKPGPPKRPSGRKPGGQPGHKGNRRTLIAPEKVDETHDVWPAQCEQCQQPLARDADADVNVGEPIRHQVVELPRVSARVTEYRLHSQTCLHCQQVTTATLPKGVPTTCFGPRLQAVVALCSGVYRLSKRTLCGLMQDLFGVAMSLGSVTACEQRTSDVLQAPVQEARRYIEDQSVAYADETGWRQRRKRAWVWVAVTCWVTVFLVHTRRNAQAARELLGSFTGILVSDRWSAYEQWPVERRQLCWAHLQRYFIAFSERRGKARELGEKLRDLTKSMFGFWHRVRDGTLACTTFQRKMRPIRAEIEHLLDKGAHCGDPKVEGVCRELLDFEPALWTFVYRPGVEPTNNTAERAIRGCVLMRKTSFGTHSEEGSRFIERMLTVAATLKQQRRNVVDYVTDACERALQGLRTPSILPSHHGLASPASPLTT